MEFFLFAGLIAVDIVWFAFLAARYSYVEDEKKKEDDKNDEKLKEEEGETNQGFTGETKI